MVIKIGKFGKFLKSFVYKDRLNAIKTNDNEVRNPDGSIGSELLDSFLQNEPCLVYKKAKDASRDDNLDVSSQEITVTVFCSSHCAIERGDILELSVLDDDGQVKEIIKGKAGHPAFFPDHLEIDLYQWKVT